MANDYGRPAYGNRARIMRLRIFCRPPTSNTTDTNTALTSLKTDARETAQRGGVPFCQTGKPRTNCVLDPSFFVALEFPEECRVMID